ncbi:MAG: transaldolase [Desulfobacterota bacterium]|nr:transaldolase [Thermodesulfobacteriota bacterium]
MAPTRTQQLKAAGQSLWLDNIQRRELHDGTLQRMIRDDGVCGVTSNPTIFMNAVAKSADYDAQILELARKGADAETIYHHITVDDIKTAAMIMLPVFEQSSREDGFVSIELNPRLAFNVEKSVQEARSLVAAIGYPNIMIKVPATIEGISVVRQLVAEGINVNVTLLFSPERYRAAAGAYIEGLEARLRSGEPLADVRSVASFFISRIDTKVDRCIDALAPDHPEVMAFRGKAAVLSAQLAYSYCRELFSSDRFLRLAEAGARPQRLLWASTGTKDPAYRDVKYVEELIVPGTINTLPPKTIDAFRDHGTVNQAFDDEAARQAFTRLQEIRGFGIDLDRIYAELEEEGVKAFEISYQDLVKAIEQKAQSLSA